MSSTKFTLPGRRSGDISYAKSSLAIAYAHSRSCNPRNIEYPWYGLWCQILMDLTSDTKRLIVVPQHLIYYEPADDIPSPEGDKGHSKRSASISTIQSVATMAASSPREVIPDFAIFRIKFRWRSQACAFVWRNVKIQNLGAPLLMEIKFPGTGRLGCASINQHVGSTKCCPAAGSILISHASCPV